MAQNTEQIIKDLEESIQKIEAFYDGMNIPKELRSSKNKKALALIKELLAENRGLNSAIETLRGEIMKYKNLAELRMQDNKDTCELLFKEEEKCKDLQAQNENLKKENKYLRERLAEEMEHREDMEGKE